MIKEGVLLPSGFLNAPTYQVCVFKTEQENKIKKGTPTPQSLPNPRVPRLSFTFIVSPITTHLELTLLHKENY